jgi:hypothetical protein
MQRSIAELETRQLFDITTRTITTRARKGLSILAGHFGFRELKAELEGHVTHADRLEKLVNEGMLSNDFEDFLNCYDVTQLDTIVKSV